MLAGQVSKAIGLTCNKTSSYTISMPMIDIFNVLKNSDRGSQLFEPLPIYRLSALLRQ